LIVGFTIRGQSAEAAGMLRRLWLHDPDRRFIALARGTYRPKAGESAV